MNALQYFCLVFVVVVVVVVVVVFLFGLFVCFCFLIFSFGSFNKKRAAVVKSRDYEYHNHFVWRLNCEITV